MIFKKLKGLISYPEFTINEKGIWLFNYPVSGKNAFKEITSTIGKSSRAFKPGNPDPDIPVIYIYDHYGIVINKSQYVNCLLGIEFHYYVYKDLDIQFSPNDVFKGKLSLLGRENLQMLTESNTKDFFPEAEIEQGFYNGKLRTNEYSIIFRFDDDSKVTSINIDIISNLKMQ